MSGPGGTAAGGSNFVANAQVSQDVLQMENKFEASPNIDRLSLNDEQFPERPAYGKKGRAVVVCTNYVELRLHPEQTLGKFKILVEPKAVGRKLHRIIELLLRQEPFRSIPHFTDFKSTLILRQNEDNKRFNVVHFAEDEQGPGPKSHAYHIMLQIEKPGMMRAEQFNNHLDPTNHVAFSQVHKNAMVHALNTMLYHHSRSNSNLVAVGKKTFPLTGPASMVQDIGGGLQIMRGFFASARLATGRVLVNVNVAYGLFYKPCTLARLMAEFGPQDFHKLERFLKHARIKKMHMSTTNEAGQPIAPMRTVFGLASPQDGRLTDRTTPGRAPEVAAFGANSRNVKFWLEEGREYITVYDYFKGKGIRLQSPELPVVNLGHRENPVYVPAELCQLPPGQHVPMRRVTMNGMQSKKMIDCSVRKPADNFRLIKDHGIDTVGLSSGNRLLDPNLVQIIPKLLGVHARVLDGPRIQYSKLVTPTGPSWNLRGHKFSKPGQGDRPWGWLYISVQNHRSAPAIQNQNQFDGIVRDFRKAMEGYGVRLREPNMGRKITLTSQEDRSLEDKLRGVSQPLSLLWVVIPAGMELLYDRIKQLADVKFGLATFVSVDSKVSEGNRLQYLGNEALKVNLKLGGRNQVIDPSRLHFISDGQTMIVGIDVIHPSTGRSNDSAPSVAAMVASTDKYLAQWPAVLSVQRKRQEMVSDLKQMLISRLEMWRSFNHGSYPQRILIYRDGVSEGQYQMVKEEELPLLKAACTEIYPEATSPRITILIVTKRHNTRFAPSNAHDADSTSNCRAGLVVDRTITEARMWNYFQQPHAAIKGHAKPAFYTIVHDEIFRFIGKAGGVNPTDMCQDISQSLCYSFGRCTRAVGIVTPTYYADIVCTRAACYLRAFNFSASASSNSGFSNVSNETDEISEARRQQLQDACQTHGNLRNTMFYI